jgi:MFS family permease
MMTFGSNPKELTKAFAVYGAAAPIGGTLGVFLGGLISEWASWPWIFFLNIPIAGAVLALTPGLMPSAPARRGSIDVLGALLATSGLAVTVFGVVRAPQEGWGSTATLLSIDAGPALLTTFVAVQASRREPLMRLGILRTPNLAAANLAQVLLGGAWIPMPRVAARLPSVCVNYGRAQAECSGRSRRSDAGTRHGHEGPAWPRLAEAGRTPA